MTIEERRPNFEVTVFTKVVRSVLNGLKAVFDEVGDSQAPPLPFFWQRCRVQCLSRPNCVQTALDLLADKVANVKKPIAPFERPPSFFGVRFRFGPVVMAQEDAGERRIENFASVRFETYADDPSQVWMEVASTHPFVEDLASLADQDKIVTNIEESYHFLTTRCKAFLDQFDKSDSKSGQQAD